MVRGWTLLSSLLIGECFTKMAAKSQCSNALNVNFKGYNAWLPLLKIKFQDWAKALVSVFIRKT